MILDDLSITVFIFFSGSMGSVHTRAHLVDFGGQISRIHYFMKGAEGRLPLFLANNPGIESGYMIAHVTASALASENKTLAHPASVDSIPTSGGQEDLVSMAPWAGYKLLKIQENVKNNLSMPFRAVRARHGDKLFIALMATGSASRASLRNRARGTTDTSGDADSQVRCLRVSHHSLSARLYVLGPVAQ